MLRRHTKAVESAQETAEHFDSLTAELDPEDVARWTRMEAKAQARRHASPKAMDIYEMVKQKCRSHCSINICADCDCKCQAGRRLN